MPIFFKPMTLLGHPSPPLPRPPPPNPLNPLEDRSTSPVLGISTLFSLFHSSKRPDRNDAGKRTPLSVRIIFLLSAPTAPWMNFFFFRIPSGHVGSLRLGSHRSFVTCKIKGYGGGLLDERIDTIGRFGLPSE